MARRYTQLTGKEVSSDHRGTKFQGTHDQIEIELKSGHTIVVEDFELKKLEEYLLLLLKPIAHFECAGVKYRKPDTGVSIDGEIKVKAQLEADYPLDLTLKTDYPLDLALRNHGTLDVKIEE